MMLRLSFVLVVLALMAGCDSMIPDGMDEKFW